MVGGVLEVIIDIKAATVNFDKGITMTLSTAKAGLSILLVLLT